MQFPRLPIDPEMLANLSVKWVLVMVGVMLISLWILRTQPLDYHLVLTRRRGHSTWAYITAWLVENIQVVLSVVVVVFLVIRPFLFQAFYIPSESMEDTLVENDRLLVNKLVYQFWQPQRGDIAVFKAPPDASPEEQDYIKRVIGVPGDTLEVVPDRVLVDGKTLAIFSVGSDYITDSIDVGFDYDTKRLPARQVAPGVLEIDSDDGQVLVFIAAPQLDLRVEGRSVYVNGVEYELPPGAYGDLGEIEREDVIEDYGGDPSLQATIILVGDEPRLVAVVGRTLEFQDAHVVIDGKPLTEPYMKAPPHYEWGPEEIPAGKYFMMGDNRNNSRDSHEWGFLSRERFVGRAEVRFWPLRRLHLFQFGINSLVVWVVLIIGLMWLRGQWQMVREHERSG